MDPSGPAQPNLNQAFNTPGNPVDKEPAEQRESAINASTNSAETTDQRIPSTHDQEATPSSLGYGSRDSSGDKEDSQPPASELEGEQIHPANEGEVYAMQSRKTGFGEQEDLSSDLDRKKAEQAGAREELKRERAEDVDVGGALGGRTGPAVVEGRDRGAV
ncbi:MAG: hypothetical protein MMC33_002297 [Icmadophila ericetorum]|nr:hypothetical protein [Icmadophila ericetorum]